MSQYPGNYGSYGYGQPPQQQQYPPAGSYGSYPPPPPSGSPYPPAPPQQYGAYPPPPPSQGAYGTPPPQQSYPPPPQQSYPPPPPQQNYPPPTQQSYAPPPPSTYGAPQGAQQQPNYSTYPGAGAPIAPPPYTGQDPVFLPTDPTLSQANYPQPPNSMHNPSSVPYGQPPPPGVSNQFQMHVHPSLQNQPPPNFQLSNCQGRKRALLVGINYFGSPNELKGCINDVRNIKQFLTSLYNFREEDMVILTDDQADPKFHPTKQNIIAGMQWLVHDARPNDSFFFHFSGHGGRVKDLDGDEDDGYDETIYPVDHKMYPGNTGQLVDDQMHAYLVRPLPMGCRLTVIFDSCHSGTALDLPYVYSTQGNIKEANIFKDAGTGLLNAGKAYAQGNVGGAISSVMSLGKQMLNAKSTNSNRVKNFKGSTADVIMFSGCKDSQTSADAFEAGQSTGAMSYAFTTALRQNRNQTLLQLLNTIRVILREKYSQRPQLSSSHPIDVNLMFII